MSLDALFGIRANGIVLGSFDKLEVTQGGQLQTQVLRKVRKQSLEGEGFSR
jgi:hypothetical protein